MHSSQVNHHATRRLQRGSSGASRISASEKLSRSPAAQRVTTRERLYEVLRMTLCQVIFQEHPNVPGVGHSLSLCTDFKAL